MGKRIFIKCMVRYKDILLDCDVTVTVSSDGKVYKDDKELKQFLYSDSGYLYITVKSNQHYLVHRLVAHAFIQPLKRGDRTLQVHHINGDKTDNRVENLTVMTLEEHQNLHKQIYPLTKICEVCGKEYIPHPTKRKRSKTCSIECKRILQSIKAEPRQRPIRQLTLDHKLIKIWERGIDIERELNYYQSNVVKCCRGEIKSYKGFLWEYAD